MLFRSNLPAEHIRELAPKGIILSGGPMSVYETGSPWCDVRLFELGVPVLGICYGMQLACKALGAEVQPVPSREFGKTTLRVGGESALLADLPSETIVWMSHGDQVQAISGDFVSLARTDTCPIAAVKHTTREIYGIQFHPEVAHTPLGGTVLRNFLYRICGCQGTWKIQSFLEEELVRLRELSKSTEKLMADNANLLKKLGDMEKQVLTFKAGGTRDQELAALRKEIAEIGRAHV